MHSDWKLHIKHLMTDTVRPMCIYYYWKIKHTYNRHKFKLICYGYSNGHIFRVDWHHPVGNPKEQCTWKHMKMPYECYFAAFRTHMSFLRPHHDVSGYHCVVITHRQILAESNFKIVEPFWNFCVMCRLITKFSSVHFDTCFQGIYHESQRLYKTFSKAVTNHFFQKYNP